VTTARQLHQGLSRRSTPEDVAEQISEFLALAPHEVAVFPRRPAWRSWYSSSMNTDWERPSVPAKSLALLGDLLDVKTPDATDPAAVHAFLSIVRPKLAMTAGHTSYKHDRANRDARRIAGLGSMSRRRYDKLFRLIARIEKEAGDLDTQAALSRLARFAKTGFAESIPYRDFAKTPSTAAFIAYHSANSARRSLFIAGPQARSFDHAAAMLFARCERETDTSWFAIAHVFPREDVLARLSLDQKVALLDKARAVLAECAERLGTAFERSGGSMNLTEMVVRRGDDSSTWNALAGSWNKARDLWISLAWTIDPSILDAFLPGKVLRLMAADVAAWHRALGGGLEPDTKVWGLLPRPWDVFTGNATCTREQVLAACREAGVDPAKAWAKPRPRTAVVEVQATPESVHGVVVGHPQLAALLRKAGWFSGKVAKPVGVQVHVHRDEAGAAVLVD
jgi:hypothetical protein